MTGKVGIVEVAQTKYRGEFDKPVRSLVYEVTKQILSQANVSREELDTIVTASSDYWQGISCSNSYYYEASGSYLKDSTKVEEDSMHAFIYALMRTLSGHFDLSLVLSVTKCSEIPSSSRLTRLWSEPFYQRPVGINEASSAALQSQKYLEQGAEEEDFAKVSAKNLKNGLYNNVAHRGMDLDSADVLDSPYKAVPLKLLECPPETDGVCAVLLASEKKATEITNNPVWIEGVGWSSDSYFLGERNLTDANALKESAKSAYKMIGIEDPMKELDVIELSDVYAPQELIWYEGLGLSDNGYELIREKATEIDGILPVNPSGGVLSTNPVVARGLVRTGEAALQVMGEAGAHQVEGVEKALAHSTYGHAGQHHSVVILEG